MSAPLKLLTHSHKLLVHLHMLRMCLQILRAQLGVSLVISLRSRKKSRGFVQ